MPEFGPNPAVWKPLGIFAVGRVRFLRGTARNRTWREVERRPNDWASRSLKREFEEVIMVEDLIEEMFGSDGNRPQDYRRAVVVDTGAKEREVRKHSAERTEKCAQKRIDRADVVRDVRYSDRTGVHHVAEKLVHR